MHRLSLNTHSQKKSHTVVNYEWTQLSWVNGTPSFRHQIQRYKWMLWHSTPYSLLLTWSNRKRKIRIRRKSYILCRHMIAIFEVSLGHLTSQRGSVWSLISFQKTGLKIIMTAHIFLLPQISLSSFLKRSNQTLGVWDFLLMTDTMMSAIAISMMKINLNVISMRLCSSCSKIQGILMHSASQRKIYLEMKGSLNSII